MGYGTALLAVQSHVASAIDLDLSSQSLYILVHVSLCKLITLQVRSKTQRVPWPMA